MGRVAPGATAIVRWALPAALLLAEGLLVSLLVDLPTSGAAMDLVRGLRLVVPVLIGGGAAGWLMARRSAGTALRRASVALPPWRPLPLLVVHLLAFAATAWLATRVLGDGAPPLTTPALAAWIACAGASSLLALATAAPLRWMALTALQQWRAPLLALVVGFLAWRAAAAAEGLWGVLTEATLRSVGALLRLVSGDVRVDMAGQLVGARGFEVTIAPICSGVDGIGLVVLFQALWIALARARLRFPRALLLLPLGAVLAVVANVLRIAALVLVGASGREDLAIGAFHSKLGWLLFIAIALGSIALAERVAWLRREETAPRSGDDGVPHAAAAYVAPLFAALAVAFLTATVAAGPLDRLYALRIAAALAALALVRSGLPRAALSWTWLPVALGLVVGVLWVAASPGDAGPAQAALARLGPAERGLWLATRVLGSVLVIPIAEELAFRGFLLPWLVSPHFDRVPPQASPWPAVALSSLAFGALHQQWILGTLAGLAFAFARRWRGKLGDAVVAHAVANAVVAGAVLWGGRWDLWG